MRRGYILFYDIRDAQRLRKMQKIALAFGETLQYSVYACSLTPTRRIELGNRVRSVINLREDRVIILDLGQVTTGYDWIPPLEAFGQQQLPVVRTSIIT
jgi:CRISPR-associated protein Cas2